MNAKIIKKPSKKESRQDLLRTTVSLTVDLTPLGSEQTLTFETTNLSLQGMFISINNLEDCLFEERKTLVKGKLWIGEFKGYQMKEKNIEFLGKIVRVGKEKSVSGIGLKIIEMTTDSKKMLEELININNSLLHMERQSASA